MKFPLPLGERVRVRGYMKLFSTFAIIEKNQSSSIYSRAFFTREKNFELVGVSSFRNPSRFDRISPRFQFRTSGVGRTSLEDEI